MFNTERARFLMIEQQIRTSKVTNQEVLNLLAVVKRENFVPPAYRQLAFADMELPLTPDCTRCMLTPCIEAQILQAVDVKKHENVLEIGTGSGYMAALLGHRARHVVSIENQATLAQQALQKLQHDGVLNVEVITGNGVFGAAQYAPFDVIVASGSTKQVPPAWLEQLKVGGRLFAFIGDTPAMQAQRIQCTAPHTYQAETLFETVVPALEDMPAHTAFVF